MAAAKLTVVDDELLDEDLLRRFMKKAKSGLASIKSALSKVLGLFEANDRLVVIDKEAPKPRSPSSSSTKPGMARCPIMSKVYPLIHDCEKTLTPKSPTSSSGKPTYSLPKRSSRARYFAKEAQQLAFGVKAPIALAKKFGSSNYSAFRRYVITNGDACCVVVLEPAVRHSGRQAFRPTCGASL